jgi:hypothetical protein
MSEFELLTLLQSYGSTISDQFNFWMATTFAVVVAVHTAGHKLNGAFRLVIAFLYLTACLVFAVRYLGAMANIVLLTQELRNIGSSLGPQNDALGLQIASAGRKLVMFGGTLVAIVLVLWPSIANKRAGDSDRDNTTRP